MSYSDFIANDGRMFSAADFNRLEAMPDGVSFYNLNLNKSSVTRLPQNLVVTSELILKNSSVKELSSGLQVHTLSLEGSDVTRIPDNCKFKNLYLAYSKVKSVGSNLVVHNNLSLSRSVSLVAPVCCAYLDLKAKQGVHTFDLSDIQVLHDVDIAPFNATVSNLKAERLFIDYSQTKTCCLELKKSSIGSVDLSSPYIWSRCTSAKLIINDTVSIEELTIRGSDGIKNMVVSIDQAHITNGSITNDGQDLTIVCDPFVVFGDFTLKGSNIRLSPNGVIYGNLTVPESFQLPPSFNCLGQVIRV